MSFMRNRFKEAELDIDPWLNTDQPMKLGNLKGKVVMLEAFQMLCPACVQHSLPQARKVRQLFSKEKVVVIGIHTVFEHHETNTAEGLKAFMYENRISFPVGVDNPGKGLPKTMVDYQMRGTPTALLFDKEGLLAAHYFGQVHDMELGAAIVTLIGE